MRRALATAWMVLTLALTLTSVALIGIVVQSGASVDSVGSLPGSLSLGASFAIVGWLIASRRSDNPLGWIYLGIGLSQVGVAFAGLASYYGLKVAPGTIPGADLLSWVSVWAWAPGLTLLVSFSLLLYPDGRLPSSRWRPVAWMAVAMGVLFGAPNAIAGWPLRGVQLLDQTGDLPGIFGLLAFVGVILFVVVSLASVASIVIRFRGSIGRERQQLKWFTYAAVPVIGFVVVAGVTTLPAVIWLLAAVFLTPLLQIAIGIAIFRYRLFEIDRIVSRTLSYALVTGVLAATFVATILVLETVLASFVPGQTIPVAASTLAVFVLFQPVMRRVRRAVDRRFDRARYDADRTAAAFAERLRDEVDLATVMADLTVTAASALSPVTTGIWIRGSEGAR